MIIEKHNKKVGRWFPVPGNVDLSLTEAKQVFLSYKQDSEKNKTGELHGIAYVRSSLTPSRKKEIKRRSAVIPCRLRIRGPILKACNLMRQKMHYVISRAMNEKI